MTVTDRRSGSASASTASTRIGGIPEGLGYKAPVRVATVGSNITLSGLQTLDDISLVAGERVLVKDQTDGTRNGIYAAASSAWARSSDFSANGEVVRGTRVFVTSGTNNANTVWAVSTADDITIGTTSIAFIQPDWIAATAVAYTADITPAQITANQNNYNPTGLSGANTLRLSSDAARNITGLAGGSDGRVMFLHNVGGFNIVLKDESSSSSAANRFALAADVTITQDQTVLMQYDSTSARWRVMGTTTSGSGSVNGPGSSTDNVVVRFDGTSGSTLQTSGILIDDSNNTSPVTTDTGALGTASLMWSDLFLASGGVLNWNNGDVTLTHSANALAFGGASSGYQFDAIIVPASSDGAALGTTSLMWSDLFLASGGVINWNNGDVTITHGANSLTFAGAANGYTFDAAIAPLSSDGAAIGSTSLMWSDLFLASGAVLNFNNGDVTITHASNTLTFAGADTGVQFASPVDVQNAFILSGDVAATISASQDNYNPISLSSNTIIRIDGGAADRNITGLSGGADGLVKILVNAGSTNNLVLKNETTSTAANRFKLGADVTLTPDQAAVLWYDATNSRWRALAVFTSSGAGSGTVTSVAVGTGLTGGPITSSGTLSLDLNALTEDTTPDATADFVPTYDTSASGHKKVKPQNLKQAGGMQLLASGTVSAAATLDIVLTSYTGYRGIVIYLSGFRPTTDDTALYMRFSTDGGSNYDATGYDYANMICFDSVPGSDTDVASGSANQMQLTYDPGATGAVGNASNEGINVEVRILNQTSAAFWTRAAWHGSYLGAQATPSQVHVSGSGARETAQDTDAVRFLFSSSTIAAGNYAVYGLI